MDLSPTEASVKRDGRERTVPVAEVAAGETIVVRRGQRIPLDGDVAAGRSAVNQAAITGESVPVDTEPRTQVFAASINEQGVLDYRTMFVLQNVEGYQHDEIARLLDCSERMLKSQLHKALRTLRKLLSARAA